MNHPDYIAAESIQQALHLKQVHGEDAHVVAGGTDLILRMRDEILAPELLIDLRKISLDRISKHEGGMQLGAYVQIAQLLAHPVIKETYPALAEACRQFAGPPIRNRGTLGGNIINASPAADLLPPLMAYDASLVLESISGQREMPLDQFLQGPGQTRLAPNELLTRIMLPQILANSATSFIKLGHRRSMAIAIVNVCTRISLAKDGSVEQARVVLGSVAPTVIRSQESEARLKGQLLSEDLIEDCARLAADDATPISDVRASSEYRKRMVRVLVRRALTANQSELSGGIAGA